MPINEYASTGLSLRVVQADILADVVVFRMARAVNDYLFAMAGQPGWG